MRKLWYALPWGAAILVIIVIFILAAVVVGAPWYHGAWLAVASIALASLLVGLFLLIPVLVDYAQRKVNE